jgi:hypothetical protein
MSPITTSGNGTIPEANDISPITISSSSKPSNTYITRFGRRVRKPALPNGMVDYTMANIVFSNDEPTSVEEALNGPDADQWKAAMDEEYNSLILNHTWKLVPLPPDRKPIDCKWVFRKKYTDTGEVEKYKARLVARGFTQVKGIDYHETFSPVVKFASIRTLLALAVQHSYIVHQMDVTTAYLNGDLEEDIYMTQPEGYVKGDYVCKLQRSLYGLKQSGRAWYDKINTTFIKLGFSRSNADPSVYSRISRSEVLYVAIYVDDLMIIGNDLKAIAKLKDELSRLFKMKDLGNIHYILGIKMTHTAEGSIIMSQTHYIDAILRQYNMEDARAAGAPLNASVKLSKPMAEATIDEQRYMRNVPYLNVIGSLMYLAQATRPDIAYAVGLLGRFASDPRPVHWEAAKHLMRYLIGTRNYCLKYSKSNMPLYGYCDADWGNDTDTRRSTTGYVFMLSNGAITWQSKRQQTVALSSTEAEYMAATQATKEATWLIQLLKDLNQNIPKPLTIKCDNQSCISIAKNPVHHQRTKHIDIQYHYVREKLKDNLITLQYCPTDQMVADLLTKALAKGKHNIHIEALGLHDMSR